jgi:hypothetical protein
MRTSDVSSDLPEKYVDLAHLNDVKAGLIATFNMQMKHEKELLHNEIDMAVQKMNEHIDQLIDLSSLSGSQLLGIIEEKKQKPIFSEKVFENRDSLLTESTKKGKEAHTVFNIFVAILSLIFLKMLVHDIFMKGYYFLDISLLYEVSEDLQTGWIYWAVNFGFSFVIVIFVKMIVSLKLGAGIYIPIYLVILTLNFVYPIYVCLISSSTPFSGIILTCEMARFGMKMHAYFREKLLH